MHPHGSGDLFLSNFLLLEKTVKTVLFFYKIFTHRPACGRQVKSVG